MSCWPTRISMIALLAFAGCSLMGLDDIDAVPCIEHADCLYASRAYPDPDGCGSYQCINGECELPSNVELCNYQDDDCNGLIDDGIGVIARPLSGEVPAIPSALAVATNGASTFVVVGGAEPAGFVVPQQGEPSVETPLEYSSTAAVPEYPCPTSAGPAACDFSELAVAADPLHLVYAAINRQGCRDGQLRIGISNASGEPFSVWLGKTEWAQTAAESDIAFGVDLDGSCTGATVGRRGASRPAVAALETTEGGGGALVSWLYAPSDTQPAGDEAACLDSEPVAVGALGVFVPRGEREWLNGTDRGKPKILGETRARSAPAVLALPNADPPAYLVAFASSSGVELVRVVTTPTELEHEEVLLVPGEVADRVVLALGREQRDGAEIGLAWSSGCGSERTLHFQAFHYSREGITTELSAAEPSIQAAGLTGTPSLLFQKQGFAVEGATGGWSLLWLESSPVDGRALRLARFREAELGHPDSVTLGAGAVGTPIVYPGNDGKLRYALVQLDSGGRAVLETVGGWCDVRD